MQKNKTQSTESINGAIAPTIWGGMDFNESIKALKKRISRRLSEDATCYFDNESLGVEHNLQKAVLQIVSNQELYLRPLQEKAKKKGCFLGHNMSVSMRDFANYLKAKGCEEEIVDKIITVKTTKGRERKQHPDGGAFTLYNTNDSTFDPAFLSMEAKSQKDNGGQGNCLVGQPAGIYKTRQNLLLAHDPSLFVLLAGKGYKKDGDLASKMQDTLGTCINESPFSKVNKAVKSVTWTISGEDVSVDAIREAILSALNEKLDNISASGV